MRGDLNQVALFSWVLLIGLSSGCAPQPSIPPRSKSAIDLCARPSVSKTSLGFGSSADLESFLSKNKIKVVSSRNLPNGDILEAHVLGFVFEFLKVPEVVRQFLVAAGVGIHLIYGRGVGEDPSFPNYSHTPDGRRWDEVPGSGGNPTRVVINRLYEGHGSVNLLLHEHAHSFDYVGIPGKGTRISNDSRWDHVMSHDLVLRDVLQKNCGDYCTENPVEAFAETFAYLHACDASRSLLVDANLARAFFQELESEVGSSLVMRPFMSTDSPPVLPLYVFPHGW